MCNCTAGGEGVGMCEFWLNEFATGRIFSEKAFIVPY